MQNPTIFVVTDQPAALNELIDLFNQAKLHSETFATAEAFLDKFESERSGCLLLDMSLPEMDRTQLFRVLAQRHSVIPVIILISQSDMRNALEALKAGAFDYFEKPFDSKMLFGSVKQALEMDGANRQALQRRAKVQQCFAQLTRREREIIDILLESKSSREIAGQLNMSVRTVEFHRAKIMKKMGAASLVELVRMIAMAYGCHCIRKQEYSQRATSPC